MKHERVTDFLLEIEQPIGLAATVETALLQQAVARNATSVPLRARLATFLFTQDRFEEAGTMFSRLLHDAPSAGWAIMLAECHISRETPLDDTAAAAVARIAVKLAVDDFERASALAALGKVLVRQGAVDEARRVLGQALEANPQDTNAYKRLASLDLSAGATDAALDTAAHLIDRGVGHSRLLVARALAFAKQGRIEDARNAVGLKRHLHVEKLVPRGWPDLDAFNAEVRSELARHPDLRFDKYGTASHKTWRIDHPAMKGFVAIPELQKLIQGAVQAQVARLAQDDSIWMRARPDRAVVHNWCVLTDAEGFEEWHVHQNGWMSGVYYVDVPKAVTSGVGNEGCLVFGLPEDLVGVDAAARYGQTVVRPEAGILALFPSHSYHRTFAHGSAERRICFAFDVIGV